VAALERFLASATRIFQLAAHAASSVAASSNISFHFLLLCAARLPGESSGRRTFACLLIDETATRKTLSIRLDNFRYASFR
jgi:hypothetical protein